MSFCRRLKIPGPILACSSAALMPHRSQNTDVISLLYAGNNSSANRERKECRYGFDAGEWKPLAPMAKSNPTGVSLTFDTSLFDPSTLRPMAIALNPNDLIMFSNAKGNALQTSNFGFRRPPSTLPRADPYKLETETGKAAGTFGFSSRTQTADATGQLVSPPPLSPAFG